MRLIALLLLTTAIFAEPIVSEKFKYYPINVYSASEIPGELKKSPLKIENKQYGGQAEGIIQFQYQAIRSNVVCKAKRLSVKVDIIYTLPKLINDHTEGGVDEIWNEWYPILLQHEKNHGEYFIQGAQDLENRITQLGSVRGCKKLKAEIKKIYEEVVEEVNANNKEYDDSTQHGITEGSNIYDYIK